MRFTVRAMLSAERVKCCHHCPVWSYLSPPFSQHSRPSQPPGAMWLVHICSPTSLTHASWESRKKQLRAPPGVRKAGACPDGAWSSVERCFSLNLSLNSPCSSPALYKPRGTNVPIKLHLSCGLPEHKAFLQPPNLSMATVLNR